MEMQIRVDPRTVTGKHTKRLRAAGIVPGVVFGKKAGSVAVQLDAKDNAITAAEEMAERLAEGVRLYRALTPVHPAGEPQEEAAQDAVSQWEREHGGLIVKENGTPAHSDAAGPKA